MTKMSSNWLKYELTWNPEQSAKSYGLVLEQSPIFADWFQSKLLNLQAGSGAIAYYRAICSIVQTGSWAVSIFMQTWSRELCLFVRLVPKQSTNLCRLIMIFSFRALHYVFRFILLSKLFKVSFFWTGFKISVLGWAGVGRSLGFVRGLKVYLLVILCSKLYITFIL